MKYSIGQKIYYRGDMANQPGWFEIASYDKKWGTYDLKEIDGDRQIKSFYECGISDVDKGHGGTRFVTEQAYKTFREQQMKTLEESFAKYRSRKQEA